MPNPIWKAPLNLGLMALLSAGLAIVIEPFSIKSASAQDSPNTTSGDRQAEANRLLDWGIQQFQVSQFREAVQSWETALQIYREIGDRQRELITLGNLGAAHRNLGEYQTAIDHHEQSLAIAQELNDRDGEGAAFGNLGNVYADLGQYQTAIDYYEQQLIIVRELGDQHGETNALGNSGLAYNNLGQYEQAIGFFKQSLALAQELGNRRGEESALGNLGNAYLDFGQYEQAIHYFNQALTIAQEIGDLLGKGAALGGLGIASRNLGQYEQAIEYTEQALAIFQEIGDRDSEGSALGNLGNIYRDIGQYEQAIDYYEQHLAIAQAIGDRMGESNALGNLGAVYLIVGQYQTAIDYTEQHLAIAQALGDPLGEGNAFNNMGAAFLWTEQYLNAENALFSALASYESLRDADLPDSSQVALFETQHSSYRLLQQTLVAQNKTNLALEVAERGRARVLIELLAATVSTQVADEVAVAPASIEEIQRIAQQQNATLVSYSIINTQELNPVLYIWVVQPTGEVSFQSVDLSTIDQPLRDLVTLSRSAIGVRGREDGTVVAVLTEEQQRQQRETQQQNLKTLYDLLIAPIADSLPRNPADRIVFIPQGDLFLVPFAALVDANDQYLIETHTLSIAPSIQSLDLTSQLSDRTLPLDTNPLIVGNPLMPRVWNPEHNVEERLPYLEGAENEAIAIAQLLGTEALLQENATETAVAEQMQRASLIHLATHGLLDYGTLEESGVLDVPGAIALAPDAQNDGLLTSAEIFTMQLSAELVVLSACDTGRGTITGDGVVGLSRSLMQAGVPSVVVSLWSVPDDSTEFLMRQFYSNLETMDKAQALRQAMLTTMQADEYSSPLDWAAFTLVGED